MFSLRFGIFSQVFTKTCHNFHDVVGDFQGSGIEVGVTNRMTLVMFFHEKIYSNPPPQEKRSALENAACLSEKPLLSFLCYPTFAHSMRNVTYKKKSGVKKVNWMATEVSNGSITAHLLKKMYMVVTGILRALPKHWFTADSKS